MQRIGGRADFGQPDIARLGPGLDDRNDVAERPLLGVGHGFLLLKGAFDIHSSSFSAVADGFTVDNSASPTASRTITGTKPACWDRSEERRVGKEGVSRCRSLGAP